VPFTRPGARQRPAQRNGAVTAVHPDDEVAEGARDPVDRGAVRRGGTRCTGTGPDAAGRRSAGGQQSEQGHQGKQDAHAGPTTGAARKCRPRRSVGRMRPVGYGRLGYGRLRYGRLRYGRLRYGRLRYGRLRYGRLRYGRRGCS
jgi:hypothetical protein